MNKFAFLVLHYNNIDETKKCISSIKEKCKGKTYEIVIVDNLSPNGSGIEIEKLYESTKNIHVILNKENLGFAKGNNVGFKYIKENIKPDYIIMCNNDTYILQEDFCELIDNEYKKSSFAIMGPKILLPNDKINYYSVDLSNINKYKIRILKYKLNLFILKCPLYNTLKKLKDIVPEKNNQEINIEQPYSENVILHGCFLIFSKKYIDLFDGIDDRTFLYGEEQLLYLRAKKNNLKTIYNPEIIIFHNEHSSTENNTNNRRKKIFYYENSLKSMKFVLEELKQMK